MIAITFLNRESQAFSVIFVFNYYFKDPITANFKTREAIK